MYNEKSHQRISIASVVCENFLPLRAPGLVPFPPLLLALSRAKQYAGAPTALSQRPILSAAPVALFARPKMLENCQKTVAFQK